MIRFVVQVVQVVQAVEGVRRVVDEFRRRIPATTARLEASGLVGFRAMGLSARSPVAGFGTPVDPPRLTLASASYGRLRLLRQAGFDPLVIVSGVDEATFSTTDPTDLVMELALAKAAAVAATVSEGLVIGADSVLDLDGRAVGKPTDTADARRRWATLAGRSGVLRTGQALMLVEGGEIRATDVSTAAATVRFGRPDEDELAAYLESGEPGRVAGAFTIDGLGAQFVDSINGDPGAVIGLSLPLLRAQAGRLGVRLTDLWKLQP